MIKVGFCVAYDWELLKISLPLIYKHADVVCLAIDKRRRSWAGTQYDIDDAAFYNFVKEVDTEKKIDLYEDDFSLPNLNKRENCNRHRTLIAERMGSGGWHIQVDADEYFLDFENFIKYLKGLDRSPSPEKKPINICCPFIPLYKKVNGGFLYVTFGENLPEFIPMATNKPDYQRARQNGHFNHLTPFYVVHETWARSEDELWFKINNWGHASEELQSQNMRLSYFNLWKATDEYNYQYLSNINPSIGAAWPKLAFGKGDNVQDFIKHLEVQDTTLSRFDFFRKNNRNIARISALIKRIIS